MQFHDRRKARFEDQEQWSVGQLRKHVKRCSGGGDVPMQKLFALEGALDEAQGLFRWWRFTKEIDDGRRLLELSGIKHF